MLQFGLLKCFELKRRYSVLFGLTDNLLKTIQEIYISNAPFNYRKKQKLIRVKKIHVMGVQQHRNDYKRQDINSEITERSGVVYKV